MLQLHESERILKQQICIVIFKFGAGIQSWLFKRIYLRLQTPGALSTVSIFVSSELPSCFSSFFCSPVLLFELQAERLSGQLLSRAHPKDKLALKFLPPVLNVAKGFFFLSAVSELFCLE